MSFSYDNAFLYLYLSAGAYQLTCARACYVARLANGCCYADRTCVGSRKLYLVSLAAGTEDRYVSQLFLRAYNGNSLFAGKLTRLRKILFLSKLVACAKKHLERFLSYVNVSCRCFNDKFL